MSTSAFGVDHGFISKAYGDSNQGPTDKRRSPGWHALGGAVGGMVATDIGTYAATTPQRRDYRAKVMTGTAKQADHLKFAKLGGLRLGASALGATVGGAAMHRRAKNKNRQAGWQY